MKYQKIIQFIAKCLTISFEQKNKSSVLKALKSKEIDWEKFVKLSSGHYLIPAMYSKLKMAGYLRYLPEDLVEYMKNIHELNKNRNKLIIKQITEIDKLLSENGIKPILLKGAAYVQQGLYCDNSERMIGDIDFLCSKEDYLKSVDLLKKDGYKLVNKKKLKYPNFKHYPRLVKKNKIAAVEIHSELLNEEYSDEFNYDLIINDCQNINGFRVLSFENQILLSILSKQVNDKGYYFNNISLRNSYDILLLSKKTCAKKAVSKLNKLKSISNCYLAISYYTFGNIELFEYYKTKKANKYLKKYIWLVENEKTMKVYEKFIHLKISLKEKILTIFQTIFNKKHREYFIRRNF